jgi:HTH-type transcriptional regulator, glycine betaine synthesis regulator
MRAAVALFSSRRKSVVQSGGGVETSVVSNGETGAGRIPTGPLSAQEQEVLDWFVDFTALLSVPASVGHIFGLMYLAGQPLPFENFVERLGISKGSVSQGLHFLRNLEAVRVVTVAGDRREFYEAEISPTRLVAGFLQKKVQPRLKASAERLARLERSLEDSGDAAATPMLADRVRRLHIWNQRARQFVPVVAGLVKIRT